MYISKQQNNFEGMALANSVMLCFLITLLQLCLKTTLILPLLVLFWMLAGVGQCGLLIPPANEMTFKTG